MPSQQGIRRNNGVELEQSLSPYGFGLPRQEGPLSVGEADAPSSGPVFEQSVLSLIDFRAPKANAIRERVIGTIRRKCLDWINPISELHLRSVLKAWMTHYDEAPPHWHKLERLVIDQDQSLLSAVSNASRPTFALGVLLIEVPSLSTKAGFSRA